MLKRIPVDRLRPGMYLHELCGSWMEHPFWRTRFLLRDPQDLRRIAASGIREVWIDTARGVDVDGGEAAGEVEERVERQLIAAATEPAPLDAEPVEPRAPDGFAEAAALYRRSKPQVLAMFHEARLGRAVDVGRCEPLVEEISRSVLCNPGALISVARLKTRDEYTYMHSVAVCALMIALARQLRLGEHAVREAGLAGMLHDVGKALMPPAVLNKPGRLTDPEFAVMRGHPERGHALLVDGGSAGAVALDVCLHHHEKVDGTGYPHRLAGERISLPARMGAVCDVYDAITSERPYKDAWDPGEALRKMAQWSGHFDSMVFQAFVKTVGIYPVGSLVRLQSGRLAVVVAQRPATLLAPKVRAFYHLGRRERVGPEDVDLASPRCQDRVLGWEPAERWPFPDLNRLWGGGALAA